VAVPVVLHGTVWGLISAATTDPDALPDDTEARLEEFTQLVAVAISYAESQARLRQLNDERAAVRRVARIVTEGLPVGQLLEAVVREVVKLLEVPGGALLRYGPGRWATVLASVDFPALPLGARFPLDGPSLAAEILDTGRPFRIDDYTDLEGTIASSMRDTGFRSAFGVPITVDGATWGLIGVASNRAERLPPDADLRLRDLTELLASAISNAEARDRLRRLAERQTALRRVATLVAEGAPAADLIAAVVQEVERALEAPVILIGRYEPNRTVTVIGLRGAAADAVNLRQFAVGSRWPLDGPSIAAAVLDTGGPARIDDYSVLHGTIAAGVQNAAIRSAIGVPIVVDRSVWGLIYVGTMETEPLPADLEDRLRDFAELVSISISRAEAYDDLRRLAEEQAALRRVATRVAEGAPPNEIFDAVADEIAGTLALQGVEMARYEPGGIATVISASGDHPFEVGTSLTLTDPSAMSTVFRTGAPARIDDYTALSGGLAEHTRNAGFRSSIAVPIVVEGAVWGGIIAFSSRPDPVTERSEVRLSQFTELVATAVSNATARADLIASRARIVEAGDAARRRFERNLHDGTQQHLLALHLDLQQIRASLPEHERTVVADLEQAERDLMAVLEEVREVSRGLHPPQLSRSGLRAALRALARRSPIPVDLEVDLDERPPAPVEAAVYYVVAEAMANAIKHSGASKLSVAVTRTNTLLRASITDDGVGGAISGAGSGLVGLRDRVEAVGGRMFLDSPRDRGTTISIELPVASPVGE
jgi:signal transduction histidine kinase